MQPEEQNRRRFWTILGVTGGILGCQLVIILALVFARQDVLRNLVASAQAPPMSSEERTLSEAELTFSPRTLSPQSALDTAALHARFLSHFQQRSPEERVALDQACRQEQKSYRHRIRMGLYDMQFRTLEAEAQTLRQGEHRFSCGYWKLPAFYEALEAEAKRYDEQRPGTFQWGLDLWQKQFPQSPTPILAQANHHYETGWTIRGRTYAQRVDTQAWEPFRQHMQQAWKILSTAPGQVRSDPQFYRLQLQAARSLGFSKRALKALLNQGLAEHPDYSPLYHEMAQSLLPKWHGSSQELTAFFNWVYETTRDRNEAKMYTAVVLAALPDCHEDLETIKDQYAIVWPLIQQGAMAKDQEYPLSLETINQLCWLACAMGDKVSAKALFQQIGEHDYRRVWKDQETFRRWRSWANAS